MSYNYKFSSLTSVGVLVIAIGLIVIVGWVFNINILTTIIPGSVSMKLNTAIGFLLSGILFINLVKGKWGKGCQFLSFLLLLFGVATFSQNLFNYNLGIDQILIVDHEKTSYPGRPSPITAFCFSLYALALLGIGSRVSYLKKNRSIWSPCYYINFFLGVVRLSFCGPRFLQAILSY